MNTEKLFWKIFYIIALLAHCIPCLPLTCMDGYIRRSKWTRYHNQEFFCCRKLTENCKPGEYVVPCKKHLDDDMCKKCPKEEYLADRTNSTNIHECVPYSCSSESKRVDYIPKTGCNVPCICNTAIGFYGNSSCNCLLFDGNCEEGTLLALNGSCLPEKHAMLLELSMRPDNPVAIPLPDLNSSSESTVTDEPPKDSSMQERNLIIGSIAGVAVILLACLCRKFCNSVSNTDSQRLGASTEHIPVEPIVPDTSSNDSLISDSGISSQDQSNESINKSNMPQPSQKKVAEVKPFYFHKDDPSNSAAPLLTNDDIPQHNSLQSSTSEGVMILNRPDEISQNRSYRPNSPLYHSFPDLTTE